MDSFKSSSGSGSAARRSESDDSRLLVLSHMHNHSILPADDDTPTKIVADKAKMRQALEGLRETPSR